MNGSQDRTLPFGLSFTTMTSPPILLVLFHEPRRRRLELAARAAPAELIVGNIALMAIGVAEMLARLGDPVELVVRQLLRQPVAAVVGEVELLGHRMEIEADRVAHAAHIGFRAAAVEIDAPDLAVGLGRQADVTGRADIV